MGAPAAESPSVGAPAPHHLRLVLGLGDVVEADKDEVDAGEEVGQEVVSGLDRGDHLLFITSHSPLCSAAAAPYMETWEGCVGPCHGRARHGRESCRLLSGGVIVARAGEWQGLSACNGSEQTDFAGIQ